MRTVLAIYRRELASYFNSALASVVLPIFLLLVGVFSLYFSDFLSSGVASMRTVFFWSAMFLALLIPALTMRLFAEEERTGSLELLLTLPVSDYQPVLGKFLAALTLVWIALALTFCYPLTLAFYADLDWGPIIGGYVGLALMGAAYCAIGVATSSFTQNQVLAFLSAMVICLVPYALGFFLPSLPAAWVPLMQHISFETHFNSLARGVIDSRDLVFYASVILLALHAAAFSLEQRRLS